MDDFNRTRRSRRPVTTESTIGVVTSTMSPKATSSNSVRIVQLPPPTTIVLTVESNEDMMMTDVLEKKAASDNKTSEQQGKAS
jgi:hypothetical protein